MEVTGSLASQVERQQLWNALMNAEYWKGAIPDAEKYEQIGPDLYEMTVKVDIGPIKGNQTVKIQFSEIEAPNSCNFDLQNSLIKTARGCFDLKDPGEISSTEGEAKDNAVVAPPEGTKTVLYYKLEADAGNPFFNAMLDGFKGKVKDGFEELLGRLETRAQETQA